MLGTAIAGAITAIGIQQVIQFAEGMQTLGDAANIAEAQFGALTKGMGDQNAIMDDLRTATGGVVSNLDLMTASNQLLKTGVLSSTAELDKFLSGVEKLKPATEDMNSAIMSMSQMLQTGATRGLNQFGINVATVKDRVDQLKAAGLSATDAFKQAVFEGMDTEINKLGTAATAAETPLLKLQTQLENIKEAASSNFAAGVEGIVNFAEAETQHTADMDAMDKRIGSLIELVTGSQGKSSEFATFEEASSTPSVSRDDQIAGARMIIQFEDQIAAGWHKATDALHEYHTQQQALADNAAAITAQSQQFQSRFSQGIGSDFESIYEHAGISMDQLMPKYLTQTQADAIKDRIDGITADAKGMKEAFKDTITSDQTNQLDAAVKSANALAAAAQKAADAFKNMTLSSMMGQGSGGIQGQVEDQVLANAQKSGMSATNLKILQDTLDMGNGRQTQASQAESKFAAGLVGLPPDVVNKAISNWVATMQAAALAGLPTNAFAGDEYGAAGLIGGGAGQKITIKSGQGLNEVMRQYGVTQAQLQAAGAYGKGILQQGSFNVGSNMQINPFYNPQTTVNNLSGIYQSAGGGAGNAPSDGSNLKSNLTDSQQALQHMVNDAQTMAEKFSHIGDSLKKISSTPIDLRFNVSGLPPWLQALFASGGVDFGGQMAKATQANGGVSPGSSSPKARGGPIVNNPRM